MPRIRAVIFDCYGTLVDILTNEGKDVVYATLSSYLRYYGSNTSAASLKSVFYAEKEHYMNTHGENYPEFDMLAVFGSILRMQGIHNPFLVESCCKLFRLISREKFQLFPDTLPTLKKLKALGYPMVMASNAQGAFFHEEIEMLGLKQFFNYFVVSSQWGFRKPDPRIFSLACSLVNVLPQEAVYIGDDSGVDVRGAQKIGLRTVLIDREKRQRDPDPRPDLYTTSLKEVPVWILQQ